jgi:hypothetical protein
VLLQLTTDAGGCFEAEYRIVNSSRNDEGQFKSKGGAPVA